VQRLPLSVRLAKVELMPEKITADSVETRQLRLVDAAGQVRAMLRVGDDGSPSLKLVDKSGDVRISLSIDESGRAAIEILRDDKVGITLHVDDRGGSARVHDALGQVRIKAEIAELEGPRIEFYNAAGLRDSIVPAPSGTKLAR
jgi:hypothetical protein